MIYINELRSFPRPNVDAHRTAARVLWTSISDCVTSLAPEGELDLRVSEASPDETYLASLIAAHAIHEDFTSGVVVRDSDTVSSALTAATRFLTTDLVAALASGRSRGADALFSLQRPSDSAVLNDQGIALAILFARALASTAFPTNTEGVSRPLSSPWLASLVDSSFEIEDDLQQDTESFDVLYQDWADRILNVASSVDRLIELAVIGCGEEVRVTKNVKGRATTYSYNEIGDCTVSPGELLPPSDSTPTSLYISGSADAYSPLMMQTVWSACVDILAQRNLDQSFSIAAVEARDGMRSYLVTGMSIAAIAEDIAKHPRVLRVESVI